MKAIPQKMSLLKRLTLAVSREWQLYVLALPAVVYLFLFHYVPMYGVQIAFKDFVAIKGIEGSPWVGFKHFERFFSTYMFERVFFNTLILSFMGMLIGFPVPIVLALLLNQIPGKGFKSDILQVCHHGGWGGTTAFYSVVDPELAIFSTSDELLPKYLQIQYNHDLVYDMHVQEVFNNAERCKTFPLPYHPSEKNLPPDPKTDLLYTEAKQLEALAELETMKNACRNLSCSNND